jgi:hypothetical protein
MIERSKLESDGDVRVAGELTSIRARRCAPRAGCLPRVGRPSWSDRVSNRRQSPQCRRAPFDPRPALRAKISDSGRDEEKVGICWAFWILTDGDVRVAGELPRQCPRWRRAHFDPRCAPGSRAGEGERTEMSARSELSGSWIWTDGDVPVASELQFDPRSALRARIRIVHCLIVALMSLKQIRQAGFMVTVRAYRA